MLYKNIGNSSLGIAIAYFTCNGYVVSIPLNDTQDYDLVVEKDKILYKVQLKGTSFKTKYNVYQVALKSCGGTKGAFYKTVKESNADLLFIVTKNRDCYLIPIEKLKKTYTLNLGNAYNKYLVSVNN
ncbi:MAG: hypothetical protein E7163_02435 [Firmicutes bacterium]|nr:hypothetical protein [Bacillota bacterium]